MSSSHSHHHTSETSSSQKTVRRVPTSDLIRGLQKQLDNFTNYPEYVLTDKDRSKISKCIELVQQDPRSIGKNSERLRAHGLVKEIVAYDWGREVLVLCALSKTLSQLSFYRDKDRKFELCSWWRGVECPPRLREVVEEVWPVDVEVNDDSSMVNDGDYDPGVGYAVSKQLVGGFMQREIDLGYGQEALNVHRWDEGRQGRLDLDRSTLDRLMSYAGQYKGAQDQDMLE